MGLDFGLVGGVYSFGCIKGLKKVELNRETIIVEEDPELTDACFEYLERKNTQELTQLLEKEGRRVESEPGRLS